ncbi:hypothetical protein FJ955_01965 [Mesorhizobium sp. B2-2-2]|nr:hypothetical protein FJ955_01965 [Mesorhizobium sp. B2-2-2]
MACFKPLPQSAAGYIKIFRVRPDNGQFFALYGEPQGFDRYRFRAFPELGVDGVNSGKLRQANGVFQSQRRVIMQIGRDISLPEFFPHLVQFTPGFLHIE